MNKAMRLVSDGAAIALACLAFYTAGWGVFDNVGVSALNVWLGFMVAFFAARSIENLPPSNQSLLTVVHIGLAVLFTYIIWRWVSIMLEQEYEFIEISVAEDLWAWLGVAITAYMTWRYFGLPMLIVFMIATLYVILPQNLLGYGEDWMRVAENLWFSSDGAFGRPVEVVGRVVLIFILFGALLQTSGAGEVLLKFAFASTGRFSGGPRTCSNCWFCNVWNPVRCSDRKCGFDRRVYNTDHQEVRLQGKIRRRCRSCRFHRRANHAAGDGHGCFSDGRHYRHSLFEHRHRGHGASADVLWVPIHRGAD